MLLRTTSEQHTSLWPEDVKPLSISNRIASLAPKFCDREATPMKFIRMRRGLESQDNAENRHLNTVCDYGKDED